MTSIPSPAAGKSFKPRVLWLVFAVILVVAAGIGALLISLSTQTPQPLWTRLLSAITGRTLTLDVSQPTVVNRIQQLQRLETVVYTMDKIVTGEKSNPILPDFLAGDRLLLIVHGEVVAGIDFTALRSGDVQIDHKDIHIHLPAAQVFSTRLDSANTRVYSRQTGLLVPTDPNLESQVRQEAERQLQEAALAGGILKTANDNAHATMTSFLQGLGFEHIAFD